MSPTNRLRRRNRKTQQDRLRLRTSALIRALVTVLLLTSPSDPAEAQRTPALRLGVIVSAGGDPALGGAAQAWGARAFAARLRAAGGIFGLQVEVIVRDDLGNPVRSEALARELITRDEVVALVCCALPAAATRVAAVAAEAGVPVLLLTATPPQTPPAWGFGVGTPADTALRAVAEQGLARGWQRFALMTLDNSFGRASANVLEAAVANAGGTVTTTYYRPDATVLTPEALWVATRQPDVVVVWGLPRDTALAIRGLRARGYLGPIVVAPATLPVLVAASRSEPAAFQRLFVPAGPIAAAATLTPEHPAYAAAQAAAEACRGLGGGPHDTLTCSAMLDALELVRAALEQTLALGLDLTDRTQLRQAVRDGLVAPGPAVLAAGSYDFGEDALPGSLSAGLMLLELRQGRLEPSP